MRYILLSVMIIFAALAEAQEAAIASGELSLDLRPSYAFSSYKDDIMQEIIDEGNAHDTRLSSSVHLQYGFSYSPLSRQGRIYPGAWQGISTSVYLFGNQRGIGSPVCLYLFQGAPVKRFNDKVSIYYEWNFGISAGWKPCDGEIAYSNLIVGSRVNAYINLGAGLKWNLNDRYSLTAGLDLTHFSNGNTSYPNPGVNMAGIRIGVSRRFGRISADNHAERPCVAADTVKPRHKLQFDLTAYGAFRKRVYRGGEEPVLLKGHFPVVGIDFAPMWQVSRIFRAGASADVQWDQSTDLKRHHASGSTSDDILFYRPPFFDQVCVGLSGRAELVMPVFSVNLGIGYNLIGPEETRASYQLANLKVRLTERLFINIGYQLLNFQKQNNLMLGIGYSF